MSPGSLLSEISVLSHVEWYFDNHCYALKEGNVRSICKINQQLFRSYSAKHCHSLFIRTSTTKYQRYQSNQKLVISISRFSTRKWNVVKKTPVLLQLRDLVSARSLQSTCQTREKNDYQIISFQIYKTVPRHKTTKNNFCLLQFLSTSLMMPYSMISLSLLSKIGK